MKIVEKAKNGIISLFKGIFNLVYLTISAIVQVFKFIITGIYNSIVFLLNLGVNIIKGSWALFRKLIIIPLMPSYKVVFSMYQVVPGIPINREDSVHQFEKGHGKKAINFYNHVVRTTAEKRIVPSEVSLVKRRRIVAKQQFGPVGEIKKLNVCV